MSLADDIRSAVATVRQETLSLQTDVTHQQWIGQNKYGKQVYDDPVTRKAIVERKQKLIKTASGQETLSQTYIAFLEPIPPNGAAGRDEPIDSEDILTLPDGSTGPVLSVTGFIDGGTGKPYFAEVYLG